MSLNVPKFDVAIIDLDPLVYRCGFSIETINKETKEVTAEPFKYAAYNINSMMKKILYRTNCEEYCGFLSSNDGSNFRFKVASYYKSNRKDARKPVYYDQLRYFLIKRWGAEVTNGQEADDACSIKWHELTSNGYTLTKSSLKTVTCSFDKDFDMIPGWHYNYIKDEFYELSEIQAYRNFYLQILTGDPSDGVPRFKKGWRQKKAEETINLINDQEEMKSFVISTIYNELKDSIDCSCLKNVDKAVTNTVWPIVKERGQLLWLRRLEGEMWGQHFELH